MTRSRGRARNPSADSSAGVAVDAQGGPVVDPTQNVLDLVNAAIERQDDLRDADQKLARAEAEHLREIADLRAAHATEMRKAEADRIDAIRAVDVDAVRRTADVVASGAIALQQQVLATAEAARVALAAYQQSATESQSALIKPLAEAIAALQVQQNLFAGGKAQVVESRDTRGETRMNVGAILGGVSILLVLIFGIAGLWISSRNGS